MKKYSVFILSLLTLAIFVAFYHVPLSTAAGDVQEGGACDASNPDFIVPDSRTCADGLECKMESFGDAFTSGKCVKITVAAEVPCTCQNPGVAEAGKNGFTCGGQTYYCNGQTNACNPAAANAPIDKGSIKDGGNIPATQQPVGVMCSAKKNGNAICKCKGPQGTDGQNFFECYKEGEDPNVMTGGGTCGSTQDQCQNEPGKFVDTATTKNYSGFLDTNFFSSGYNISGIACRRPVAECKCDNPGAIGTGRNTFTCTQLGQTQKSTCDDTNYACLTAPDKFASSDSVETDLFSGAPLKGIQCKVQRLPTPPPPPCLQWSGGAPGIGQCLQVGTAVGELSTDPSGFISRLFAVLLSMSGGIALLLIMKAGYQMMTSQGNPEKINSGRDQLIAAIVGLVFLLFSFVILEVIGFNILQIPGFGG